MPSSPIEPATDLLSRQVILLKDLNEIPTSGSLAETYIARNPANLLSPLAFNSVEQPPVKGWQLWQSRYDPLESLFDASTLAQDASVLDIGGGSGQTLRRLFPGRKGAVLDIVPVHIAFGSRIWRLHKLPIIGICGSAEHLPCADASIDFVVCRGVIMYTDHQTAVNEVFRVLKKGCHAFFRVESFWWDLNVMRQTRNPVTIAFGLRSLLVGKVLGATGVQPRLGRGWLFGPRAYVTPSRFRKMVHAAGGDVLRYESSKRGPQVGGHGTQDVVLCVKR